MLKPPFKHKRQSGELLCASVIFALGIAYGLDVVSALRGREPLRIWSDGYLVTDSPGAGLALSLLLIALSIYIFTSPRRRGDGRPGADQRI